MHTIIIIRCNTDNNKDKITLAIDNPITEAVSFLTILTIATQATTASAIVIQVAVDAQINVVNGTFVAEAK